MYYLLYEEMSFLPTTIPVSGQGVSTFVPQVLGHLKTHISQSANIGSPFVPRVPGYPQTHISQPTLASMSFFKRSGTYNLDCFWELLLFCMVFYGPSTHLKCSQSFDSESKEMQREEIRFVHSSYRRQLLSV